MATVVTASIDASRTRLPPPSVGSKPSVSAPGQLKFPVPSIDTAAPPVETMANSTWRGLEAGTKPVENAAPENTSARSAKATSCGSES